MDNPSYCVIRKARYEVRSIIPVWTYNFVVPKLTNKPVFKVFMYAPEVRFDLIYEYVVYLFYKNSQFRYSKVVKM